jgi:heat shock protein HslJ
VEDPLIGTWDIVRLLPGGQTPSQPASITFDGRQLHFFAGCNRAVGPYALESNGLRAGPVALTMMYCPDMTVERHLCTALGQPLQVDVVADRLVAVGPRGGFEARRTTSGDSDD